MKTISYMELCELIKEGNAPMHIQGPTFMADVSSSEAGARAEWNQRKRKNKITWEGRSE